MDIHIEVAGIQLCIYFIKFRLGQYNISCGNRAGAFGGIADCKAVADGVGRQGGSGRTRMDVSCEHGGADGACTNDGCGWRDASISDASRYSER